MIRYLLTIFLSAFLLFQIQPIAARLILPAFGGTSTVWATCMMFFQVALLLGYLYAHCLRTILRPVQAWLLHSTAAIVAFALINFSILGAPPESSNMSFAVSLQLGFSIGLPFLILSATSPLVQAWYAISETAGAAKTYRLYAFSNIGSLLALISYPFFVERFGLSVQAATWKFVFLGYILLVVSCGFRIYGFNKWSQEANADESEDFLTSKLVDGQPATIANRLLWLVFSALASMLLISTSNILCQEMASFPFLWILPLTLYMLTLVICFDRPQWYCRRLFYPAFAISIFAAILLFHLGTNSGLVFQIVGFASVLFFGAMVCHGELYGLKPATQKLTQFYLFVSLGGAIGGSFAVVLAPRIFDGFYEFHASLILILFASAFSVWRSLGRDSRQTNRLVYSHFFVSMLAAAPVVCSLMFFFQPALQPGVIFRERNEYGIVTVSENDEYRKMLNGQTNHGGQFLATEDRMKPSAYYSVGSGAEVAFSIARNWQFDSNSGASPRSETGLDVTVIGLGTGSMLAHAEPIDRFRFYEINPLSESAARQYFSFLDDFPKTEVVIGDGRLRLAEHLSNNPNQKSDILFVDAFSSDSIPVHLLTAECVDLYMDCLQPNGILVFHITNKYVDLLPVIQSIVDSNDLASVLINHENKDFDIRTRWVLLSRQKQISNQREALEYSSAWPSKLTPVQWTDDSSSLTPGVKWSNQFRLGDFSEQPELPNNKK